MRIKLLDYVTVKQLSLMFDLKGRSNKYRVIKQLEPYLHRFKYGNVTVYALNRNGREMVWSDKKRECMENFDHYMMRNDLYIASGCPVTWRNETTFTSRSELGMGTVSLRPDAYYMDDGYHLIEIDNKQDMREKRKKVERYRKLIERGTFSGMPKLKWVTRSSYREKELYDLCDGLNVTVHLWSEIDTANQ